MLHAYLVLLFVVRTQSSALLFLFGSDDCPVDTECPNWKRKPEHVLLFNKFEYTCLNHNTNYEDELVEILSNYDNLAMVVGKSLNKYNSLVKTLSKLKGFQYVSFEDFSYKFKKPREPSIYKCMERYNVSTPLFS